MDNTREVPGRLPPTLPAIYNNNTCSTMTDPRYYLLRNNCGPTSLILPKFFLYMYCTRATSGSFISRPLSLRLCPLRSGHAHPVRLSDNGSVHRVRCMRPPPPGVKTVVGIINAPTEVNGFSNHRCL